jgi:hypothetical protein
MRCTARTMYRGIALIGLLTFPSAVYAHEKWFAEAHADAQPTRDALAAWGRRAVAVLKHARPTLPETIGDRQADVWEPLLAIADLAGDPWPARARAAPDTASETAPDSFA